jgi:hypothetical protein
MRLTHTEHHVEGSAELLPSAYQRCSQQNTVFQPMQLQAGLAYHANELESSATSMPSGLMIQMASSVGRKSFVVEPSPMGGGADHQDFHRGSAPIALSDFQPCYRHTQWQPHSLPNYAKLERQEKSKSHSRLQPVFGQLPAQHLCGRDVRHRRGYSMRSHDFDKTSAFMVALLRSEHLDQILRHSHLSLLTFECVAEISLLSSFWLIGIIKGSCARD